MRDSRRSLAHVEARYPKNRPAASDGRRSTRGGRLPPADRRVARRWPYPDPRAMKMSQPAGSLSATASGIRGAARCDPGGPKLLEETEPARTLRGCQVERFEAGAVFGQPVVEIEAPAPELRFVVWVVEMAIGAHDVADNEIGAPSPPTRCASASLAVRTSRAEGVHGFFVIGP